MRSNKKLKKRGQSINYVILYLVIIGLIIAFLYFFDRFGKTVEGSTPAEICKSSVKIQASQHMGDLYVDSPIQCPTQQVIIETEDKEEIMKELADDMFECWDMFGRGKLNLFPHIEGTTINYCVICHHITFENKNVSINVLDDFNRFLMKEKPKGS